MKAKRPKLRTPENAERICAMLAEGHTLRQVAQQVGCDHSAILHWVREDQDAGGAFSHRYARAMELRCERMAEEILEISDADYTGPDGRVDYGAVQQARLRLDGRRWLLSKWMPRRYGDRISAEVVGDPASPLVTRIELIGVSPPLRPELDLEARVGEATVTTLKALPSR